MVRALGLGSAETGVRRLTGSQSRSAVSRFPAVKAFLCLRTLPSNFFNTSPVQRVSSRPERQFGGAPPRSPRLPVRP